MTSRIITILICCISALPSTAFAEAVWKTTGNLAVTESFDDNILYTGTEALETRVVPSVDLSMTTDRLRAALEYSLEVFQYLDDKNDNLDRQDHNFVLTSGYEISPLVNLGFDAGFTMDKTTERLAEEEGVVVPPSDRYQYDLNPGISFVITPRDTLNVDYGFDQTSYDRSDYFDSISNLVSLGATHQFTELISGNVSLSTESIDSENNEETNNTIIYSADLGGGYLIENLVRFSLTVGVAYVDFGTSDEITYTYGVSVRYSLESSSLVVSSGRSLRQSVFQEILENENLSLSYNYRLTELLSLSTRLAFNQSKAALDGESIDYKTYNAGLGLNYRLTRDLRLTSNYSYTYSRNDAEGTTDRRHRVSLGLSWQMWESVFLD